jgi:hypothetical protein
MVDDRNDTVLLSDPSVGSVEGQVGGCDWISLKSEEVLSWRLVDVA